MPQIAAITITNATTPARNFTFSPLKTEKGILYMVDRTTESQAELQPVVSLELDTANATRTTDKFNLKVSLPKVIANTVTDQRELHSIGRFTGSGFIFPGSWTAYERETLVHLVMGLLQNESMIHSPMVNREGYY